MQDVHESVVLSSDFPSFPLIEITLTPFMMIKSMFSQSRIPLSTRMSMLLLKYYALVRPTFKSTVCCFSKLKQATERPNHGQNIGFLNNTSSILTYVVSLQYTLLISCGDESANCTKILIQRSPKKNALVGPKN